MRHILFIIYLLFIQSTLFGQIITTVAGNGSSSALGDGGYALMASVGEPYGLITDDSGNCYFTDVLNNKVRKISSFGIISTVAGTMLAGYNGDGILATAAELNDPTDVAINRDGNIYIVDKLNHRIRKIDISTGLISTVVGNGSIGYSGDGGAATLAQLNNPQNICFDHLGNLYISDAANNRIRKVDTFGIITTIAGNGAPGFYGDGAMATAAEVQAVYGMCADNIGNLFFSQNMDYRVRRIDVSGVITTIAGNGLSGSYGDGGMATNAALIPYRLALDNANGLYISGITTNNIRKIDLNTGIIYTQAGTGTPTFSGDSGLATLAGINSPIGIHFDYCHNLLIADEINHRIRKVTFNPLSPTSIPSISISAVTSDTVCSGLPITFTAIVTGGGTYLFYQWFVNGVSVSSGGGNTYTFTPSSGDSINCIVTTANSCSTPASASSNTIHITVVATTPTISITANPPGVVCLTDGSFVTFNATATSGGSSPVYQWKKNGANTGISATSYTYIPADGDSIRCVLTSSEPCASPAVVSSNMITMTVDTIITPVITLSGSSDAAIGSTVTITASVASAGTSYIIYWMNHGTIFSTTSVPVTSYVKMADTDTITAKIIVTSGGCYDSTISQFHTVFNANEGINDFIEQGVTVFPVPVKDILHITGIKETTVYTLCEMTGRAVMAGALLPKENEINISNLAMGMYLLQVQYRDGQREIRKIVKA